MDSKRVIRLKDEEVQPILQHLFNITKWGIASSGYLAIDDDEWQSILANFKMMFNKRTLLAEYEIDEYALYMFINQEVYHLISSTNMKLVNMGKADLCVDQNGDFVFKRKEDKGEE